MLIEHFEQGPCGAARNMALDLLLLEDYPRDCVRLRHYAWAGDCFTFGYSQPLDWIRMQVPEASDIARRPTGGGLVDHRNDWTFALALPPAHPMHRAPALEVYKAVHEAVAAALRGLGRGATLQPAPAPLPPGMPAKLRGACFAGAEEGDVIDTATRRKIAGAAMKRNRHGLLLQGSVDKLTAGIDDWEGFGARFIDALAKALDAEAQSVPPPPIGEEALARTVAMIAAPEWLGRR